MTDEVTIHIDTVAQHSDVPGGCPDVCPDCGTEAEHGFGMAGGGMGVYTFCPKCEKMLGKVQCE